jgi:putative transposase
MGRPMSQLTLSADERSQLESMARSRSMPAALVQRAKIVLACAEGAPNTEVAECLGTHKATVGLWRRRFVARRIAGLYDERRPGKPRTIDDERVAELIHTTLHKRPSNGATQWSVRDLEAETGISKTSVQRYLSLFGVQPHRTQSFKLSTDPFFVDKLRDVVGLYLNPPDTRWSCASTRRANARPLNARSPCCRWAWATSRASRTITSVMARPHCSPLWMFSQAQCSVPASRVIATRNF